MLLFTKNSFQLNNCLRMFARNIITYALRTTRSTAPKISQPPNLKVFQAIKAKQPAKVKLTP